VLQINVRKEPEASVTDITVRADGKVTLPLVKEIAVAGLKPEELEKLLSERLERFFLSPEVTVLVRQVNSEKVYVLGAVRKEGTIFLRASMTVLQVLSEAGGLTDYAKRKKIYILRDLKDKHIKIPFNYESVIKGEATDQNIVVLPGDTIVVPQ
jgi:polysaccharide biosynthesis/export protein